MHFSHSKEEEIEFIKQSWKDKANGTRYGFAMTTHDGKYLGICGIFNLSRIHRSGTIGIGIHHLFCTEIIIAIADIDNQPRVPE